MFCMKCGRPTEGDRMICPDCEAAQQASQFVAEPAPQSFVADTIPAEPQQPVLELNLEANAPVPTKKKSKKKPLLITVAVLLVATLLVGIVGCLFFGWAEAFRFFWVKLTKSDKEAALYVEEQAISQGGGLSSGLYNLYGNLLATSGQATGHTEMVLDLELGDKAMEILSTAIFNSNTPVYMDTLLAFQKIQISADVNATEDATQIDLGLGLNDTQIITLQTILDFAAGRGYIGAEDVNPSYLAASFAQMGIDVDEFADILAASTELSAQLVADLPSQEDFEALTEKYILLALSNIDKVKESSEKVDVNDVEKTFTVYSYTIDQAAAQKMALAVLKEAENDETLYAIVEAYCTYYNNYMSYMAQMDPYSFYYYDTLTADDLFDAIPDLIDELENADADSDEALILKTYVDSTGAICGRKLSDSENSVNLSWITVSADNKEHTEIKVGSGLESVSVVGSATVKDGKRTGSYKIKAMGMNLFTLSLENFDIETFTGTVRFGLSKAMQEQLLSELSYEAEEFLERLGGTDIQLELTLQKKGVAFALLVADEKVISFGLSTEEKAAEDVLSPENYILVEEGIELASWAESLDLSDLYDRLEKAGVDSDLVDSLRQMELETRLKDTIEELYYEEHPVNTEDSDEYNEDEDQAEYDFVFDDEYYF